ncbi:MAG: hypothetical protein A3J83_02185 [Elusimicrobia bacterium RIFOXYA2_FULL_40_6]|nr:MAG: hypothetical protein A3J83_02185 [Elusimicrobia bacterium RIFOXYA2_FULL_40_6]
MYGKTVKKYILVLVLLSLNMINGCCNRCILKGNDSGVKKTFRVIAYNVLEGFNDGSARDEKVAKWLKAEDPDVVALEELNNFNEELLQDLAAKWGHPYVVLLKTEGYPTGLTSKQPITDVKRVFDNMHHGLLECKTQGIYFFVVHLSPFDHKLRQSEADIILKELGNIKKGEQSILLGDFNSFSAADEEYYKRNNTLEYYKSQDEKRKSSNLNDGNLDFTVIEKFEKAGLTDMVRKYYKNGQTQISGGTPFVLDLGKSGDIQKRNRIDYIMATAGLASKSVFAYVENNDSITGQNSDHYPVIADFEF